MFRIISRINNAGIHPRPCGVSYGRGTLPELIEIHYDYNGIERWVTGEWKAKKEETEIYRDKMRSFFEMIDIGFVHVKGHSGDKYNDKADGLAKMGAMILSKEDMTEDTPEDMENEEKTVSLESKKEKGLLEVGEGANEKCKKAISKFKKKCKPRFLKRDSWRGCM